MVNFNVKDQVKRFLILDERTRDNDALLCAMIWWKELKGKNMTEISVFEFFKIYASNTLTNYESVRRCRAKIQEEEPSLRGKTYRERQIKGQKIKKTIK